MNLSCSLCKVIYIVFMESLNRTLENALNFVYLVQNACDKKRFLLEETYKREFNVFLKECKQAQKEKEKHVQEEIKLLQQQAEQEEKKKADNDNLKSLENEELALADALLHKARLIRQKLKLPSDEVIQDDSLYCHTQAVTGARSKTAQTKNMKNHALTNHVTNKMSHSQSAIMFNHCKKPVLPHSKSDNLPNNGSKISKSSTKVSMLRIAKEYQNSSANKKQTSVITKKVLDTYRKTVVPKKKGESNNGDQIVELTAARRFRGGQSDLLSATESQSSDAQSTHVQFREKLKTMDISRGKNHLGFFKSKMWYPFLSTKNENHLSHHLKFRGSEDLSKICILLHKIQETMLWLDAFSLISIDLAPILKVLDESNIDHILICSYLQSLFHKYSQRIPVLAPD